MKLICTQENFKKAIYGCEKIVAKKSTLPILNNILLRAKKGSLILLATNLEIGISIKVNAKIEKEGEITIPAQLISNFATNLSTGKNIELETINDKLKIKSDSNKTIIKGLLADDFPLIPSRKGDNLFKLSSLKLKEIILKVIPAVAFNETRQELTGINIIFKEKEFFLAATDSFRLSECRLNINSDNIINLKKYTDFINKNKNIIIPAGTLIEINRLIQTNTESQIEVAIEENQIFFEVNNIKIVSRLINGKYPEYKNIIPKEYKTVVIGEKETIQNAVKMASLFTSRETNEITLKIDSQNKKVFILSKSSEIGENSTKINFNITGPSQEVVFNAKYFLDGINIVSSYQLAILLNNDLTPVAIKEVDNKTKKTSNDFIYIVMPIKN